MMVLKSGKIKRKSSLIYGKTIAIEQDGSIIEALSNAMFQSEERMDIL
jgi:hypothetical protein